MTRNEMYQNAIEKFIANDDIVQKVITTLGNMDEVYNFLNEHRDEYFTPTEIALALNWGIFNRLTGKMVRPNFQLVGAVLHRLFCLHIVDRMSYKIFLPEIGETTCYRWRAL